MRVSRPSLPPLDDYRALLESTWDGGWLSNFGPHAQRFEQACADYTALAHVRAAANCDLALTLGIRALGLGRGDRVVVPSFTFPTTLHALLWNGLEPVFADVDRATWCLTAESAAAVVDGARAIVGTHSFMSISDVAGLERLAAGCEAVLLFDAAQAFATWVGERHVGAFGDLSVFSFSPTKIATCGEGGLAAFRAPAAAELFAAVRTYGDDHHVGLNARMSEPHAALGRLAVERVEEEVTARLDLVTRYRARLADLPEVRLQETPPGVRATPTLFVADFGERRAKVEATLGAEGIETLRYFRPLHEMPAFGHLPAAPLRETERLGAGVLALPLHRVLDVADVDHVCDLVERAVRR